MGIGATAVCFGEGSQVGDVSIRDIAGRDVITVNVYHGAPTTTPLPEPRPTSWWLHVVVTVPAPDVEPTDEVVGVDLGIAQPAVTSNNR